MAVPACNSPGFSEAVVSVSDLESWITFFEDVFEWNVIYRGPAGRGVRDLWQLPSTVEIEDALVRDPDAPTTLGAIRLVQFKNVAQCQARPNAYAWDTGGFFDMHVQVRDVNGVFEDMQRLGWTGYSQPKRIEVNGVVLNEVFVRGPDGVVFALIERVSPEFQVIEGYRRVSPAWNVPQMVAGFDTSYQFYANGLGFKATIDAEMPPEPDGDNLYGLPLNVAKETNTRFTFFHPTGERGAIGSVDILRLVGLQGHRFGEQTRPPNLGLILIRIPVVGVESYAAAVTKAGVEITGGPIKIDLNPFERTKAFSVRSPEGAWIEFYEADVNT